MIPVQKYEDEGKPRKLPKKGWHNARLKVISDNGTVKATDPKYSDRRMMSWLFELVDLSNKTKSEWIKLDLPFNGKSKNLQKLLGDWLGILPAQMLRKDFKIEELLDEPAEINIVHSPDGKWANIVKEGGVSAPSSKKVKPGFMKPLCVTLIPEEFDMAKFKQLPNFLQNKAMESDEFIEVSEENSYTRRKAKNSSAKANKKAKRGR